jgi:hypothetical protein
MFAPGLNAVKSGQDTASMVAGFNPWLALGGSVADALGGGPSSAGSNGFSGGNPINLGPVNIGRGSASGNQAATANPTGGAVLPSEGGGVRTANAPGANVLQAYLPYILLAGLAYVALKRS